MSMKSYSYVVTVFILTMTMFLSGCGGSGNSSTTSASGTGAISAKLVWSNDKVIAKSVASAPAGVVTVRLAISGLQQDFPASSGIGQIDNVPIGSGLTVTAMGLDATGLLTHQGVVTNVTIQEKQTTDVGTIIMLPVTSTLKTITVSPANTSLAVGATRQFTATGMYSDNTTKNLTSVVSWSSSNPLVATVAPTGLLTPLAAGSTTITAKSGAVNGTATISVTALPVTSTLTSLTVTPANTNLAVGVTRQLTAAGTYSDNTTKDLTSVVTWSSSSQSVATISVGGVATTVAVGSTTISATYSGVTGTTLLTVEIVPCIFPKVFQNGVCVDPWTTNPSNNHKYKTVSCSSWSDCENQAVAQGGHLATVRSGTENAWLVQTFGFVPNLYIGLNDITVENNFVWVSGDGSTFRNWAGPYEPNNAFGDEDCTILSHGPTAVGLWNDVQCSSAGSGIIEVGGALASLTDPTTGMVLNKVNGGTFTMGDTFGDGSADELPLHQVTLSDFYIGRYEVTHAEWQTVMTGNSSGISATPSYFAACGASCPVEQVSWNDIQIFISRLNSMSGKSYRLPTEAEWEYAARSGGQSQKYSGGSDANAVAWTSENSGSSTHIVGQKLANGLGLYDMSGNVGEWVSDWHSAYGSAALVNPTGPESSTGGGRVYRGGSWYDIAVFARAAIRFYPSPDYRFYDLGFRLASPVQ